MSNAHLHDQLAKNSTRVTVETAYGPVTGGRAENGAAAFLEIPFALPPKRFEDAEALPPGFKYDEKEYIRETAYAVQPKNDGQARDTPFEDKVGYGKPSENPLFLNIVTPPSFPERKGFPVRVYVHGGFLQFGSPHSLSSQAQYIAAERSEIWVNIGYRLSAFGFLASDQPKISGNYGFKDQWLALEWIRSNIGVFGGNVDDIQLTGLSAGAHSVHQLLHHACTLPEGQKAPFHTAILQSNAILTDPKTPQELRLQYQALCGALNLDPEAPDTLVTLKDPTKVSWDSITHVIETDMLGTFGTFRGCLSDDWINTSPGPMANQRSGEFARGLQVHGVKSLIIGDLAEEWYIYSLSHPISSPKDILPNLERYFNNDFSRKLLDRYDSLPDSASAEESQRLFGEVLSCGQVHLPVRILASDLLASDYPFLRYSIQWTPEQNRVEGYVTHGTDRCLWAFRIPLLNPDQIGVARTWLIKVFEELTDIEKGTLPPAREVDSVFALRGDKTVGWEKDKMWDEYMEIHHIKGGARQI